MNLKIKILKAANYTNLISLIIFLGIAFYHILFNTSVEFTSEDLWGFLVLFLIVIIFSGNFYYTLKLISNSNKEINTDKLSNKFRLTFFIFEILLLIGYSILIYDTMSEISLHDIDLPRVHVNISRLIALTCLFTGYISSIMRLLLTRPVLRIIAFRDKQLIEELGSNSNKNSQNNK